MGKVAFVFPGQGSQSPGMGRDLLAALPAAREAFAEMDAATAGVASRLCLDASAEELALTENTQPSILAVSVAAWRALDARGVRADYLAGHSLGEYSALVAAGVLSAGEAVATVRRRGAFMQEAVPVGEGAMAALLGMERGDVEALCARERREGEVLSAANYNAPGQVVIAGHRAAVERAAASARKAIMLPVSAPFHCALMAPAAERLRGVLAGLTFRPFRTPVVANVDARENSDPERARALLVEQVTAPVRWDESVARLAELGVDTFVEVGPGRVLAGLVRKGVGKSARILNVGTALEVDQAAAALAS